MSRFDLVVIGGGTAGLTAAVTAAGVGARVALVERDRTGGDCLWTGCVPSKTLVSAARAAHTMRTADRFGLDPVEPAVDLGRVMDEVHASIAAIAPHDSPERLRREGVEVVHGEARFVGPGTIDVAGRHLETRTALIATGSRPALPPVEGLVEADPITSDTVWRLRALPRRLVVLGAGPVGCELGQAFARLGSAVTLVEMVPTVLPAEEPEAQALVSDRLKGEGVDVRTGAAATRVRREGDAWTLELDDGSRVAFDRILAATGRRPHTDGLGLDRVGVERTASGHVQVDDTLRTGVPGVLAAGDVTGRLPFTHVAAAEGSTAMLNGLFGLRRRVPYHRIPYAVFTDPEVAHAGLTEADARERHDRVVVRRFDYARNDRAVTARATAGIAKLVADGRGRLLGATVVGDAAGESIAELVAWMANDGTLDALGAETHAYPTFSEGPRHAALEHLREKYHSRRIRSLARPYLWLRRTFHRRP